MRLITAVRWLPPPPSDRPDPPWHHRPDPLLVFSAAGAEPSRVNFMCSDVAGAVIRDHDLALGYLLHHDPGSLPCFSALPPVHRGSVAFTQADLQFNHGHLVQAEAPPGAIFATFKQLLNAGCVQSADVRCHGPARRTSRSAHKHARALANDHTHTRLDKRWCGPKSARDHSRVRRWPFTLSTG